MVNPESLAIIAAILFAVGEVTMKRGLASTTVLAGLLLTLATAWLTLSVAVLFEPPRSFDLDGMLFFALAGFAGPGVARWGAAKGVNTLGPSIAVPIAQGVRPLLAVIGAVILLGERLEIQRALGLIAILAGGWQLSRRLSDTSESPTSTARTVWRDLLRPGVAFPLIAGLSYALQDILAKKALGSMPFPTFGAFVGLGCALAVWGSVIATSDRLRERVRFGPGKGWLAASGLMSGLALISLFHALEYSDISLVSPIIATQPLAVLILSFLLLKGIEFLHLRTIIGAGAVVLGTAIVTL